MALVAGLVLGAAFPAGRAHALASAGGLAAIVAALCLGPGTRAGCIATGLFVFVGALQWGRDSNLRTLFVAPVLNTDLLLSIGGMSLAFLGVAVLATQASRLGRRLPRTRRVITPLLALCLILPLSGALLLSLMRLEMVEVTTARLSFVALTTNSPGAVVYATAACGFSLALVAAVSQLRSERRAVRTTAGPIERRLRLARYRETRRLVAVVLLAALLPASAQAYWEAVASRPPQRTAATPTTLGPDERIHLPLANLVDGNLHRFLWQAPDGTDVRFFVINRFAGKTTPAVVFDACALCGDPGYAKQEDRVVCIACGVQLLPPSIGKAGGCNPIPLENYRIEKAEIVIDRADLEKGIVYFRNRDGRSSSRTR